MEYWRDIKGYEGLYEISNEGKVRSTDRIIVGKSRWGGLRKMRFNGKEITQFKGNNGYMKVTLSKDGKLKSKDVHRLVYEAFNGEIPENLQVNHIDENKTNNSIENLNLLSPKENTNYGTGIERMKKSKQKRANRL